MLCNTLMVTRGKDGGRTVRESGMDMDTLLDLAWRTSKDLLDSTGDSAQCLVAAWMGGEFGEQWLHIYVYMPESLCCPPETITTLLTDYTTIQNKNLKNITKKSLCYNIMV